jgi:hypothetical protein
MCVAGLVRDATKRSLSIKIEEKCLFPVRRKAPHRSVGGEKTRISDVAGAGPGYEQFTLLLVTQIGIRVEVFSHLVPECLGIPDPH